VFDLDLAAPDMRLRRRADEIDRFSGAVSIP
jgi:hypothetical protein